MPGMAATSAVSPGTFSRPGNPLVEAPSPELVPDWTVWFSALSDIGTAGAGSLSSLKISRVVLFSFSVPVLSIVSDCKDPISMPQKGFLTEFPACNGPSSNFEVLA